MNYPDLTGLSPELQAILDGKQGANVYKMLMHSPNVAPSFTAMADALMWNKSWPAIWRELAIVRVGHHYGAAYEIYHHERIGRLVGVNDAQLAACHMGADQAGLTEEECHILRLTDALVVNHRLTPAEREAALVFLNANQLADLVMTVGYYQMVCNFLNTFEVAVETSGPLAPGAA